ncbi:SufS family cysteine desulfurase [Treponema vincentii F0403]|uniref:Cysteine desulfurase n=1 Tax=Treponema vincentii F0403 TaxID=1125702 RepID=S3L890_9SPIR|nr:SufS family cysteine desulfurase [Treponema vincentii]EPF45945.1 SufS family cysteine desulfurase [Treponema vincentii F0403]
MYKQYFPLLQNRNIHYLDAAATAQRPQAVLDGIQDYYTRSNGNAGRGSHTLAIESSALIEAARMAVGNFIGADSSGEVIFTKNATESLNIIAYCYGLEQLHAGDEIIISIANHHANLIPWQFVARKTGAALRYVYLDENGNFDMEGFKALLGSRTKIVAVTAAVNTTGVVFPVQDIIAEAHKHGAVAVIDAAQSIAHYPHDVAVWDCDFLAFSGHKIYAEFGAGVLYAKRALIDKMSPFLYGGSMIEFVGEQVSEFKAGGAKYEGGTLDTAAIHSIKLSLDFLKGLGLDAVHTYVEGLHQKLIAALQGLDFVDVYYTHAHRRVPTVAFNVKDVHSHDTSYILDEQGVMVRSGHHCTQPLMEYMGIHSCCRASLGIYNTQEDIDALVAALKKVYEVFKR